MFERARLLEEGNNKLAEAVALYTQLAAETSDRQLAAAAQLRLGLLHERLGRREEAVKAFTAVTRLTFSTKSRTELHGALTLLTRGVRILRLIANVERPNTPLALNMEV